MAFAGAAVIGVASSSHHRGGPGGVLLCALAAAVYSVAVVIEKPVLARVSPVAVTWAACVAGAVACLPFAPALVGELGRAPAPSTLLVVYLGVGPTAIAFTTWATRSRTRRWRAREPRPTSCRDHAQLDNPRPEVPVAVALLGGVLCLAGVAATRHRPTQRARAVVPR